MSNVLVVGAGLAGAVHARQCAEAGHHVQVIDKRPHIAGNCHDYVGAQGVRIHQYGPHLFHTSNGRVVEWLSRFTEWLPYEHRVVARLPDGRMVPSPVNLDTVNAVFGTNLTDAAAVEEFLDRRRVVRTPVANAEDHLYGTIGPELTNLFFRPYTKKMWDLDLENTDAAVVRRLQIRTNRTDKYFLNDTFQAMPQDGYTRMFERIFDHPRISVELNRAFEASDLAGFDVCFNSMPIDEFYGFDLGELPYRSIRFHRHEVPVEAATPHVVINYTDQSPMTRETWWHLIPGHRVHAGPTVIKTVEEPCDYRDNGRERYYPVKTSDGRHDALYARYAERAARTDKVIFIGRCGTYQYLDMHQVINQSLLNVERWLSATGAVPARPAPHDAARAYA